MTAIKLIWIIAQDQGQKIKPSICQYYLEGENIYVLGFI